MLRTPSRSGADQNSEFPVGNIGRAHELRAQRVELVRHRPPAAVPHRIIEEEIPHGEALFRDDHRVAAVIHHAEPVLPEDHRLLDGLARERVGRLVQRLLVAVHRRGEIIREAQRIRPQQQFLRGQHPARDGHGPGGGPVGAPVFRGGRRIPARGDHVAERVHLGAGPRRHRERVLGGKPGTARKKEEGGSQKPFYTRSHQCKSKK